MKYVLLSSVLDIVKRRLINETGLILWAGLRPRVSSGRQAHKVQASIAFTTTLSLAIYNQASKSYWISCSFRATRCLRLMQKESPSSVSRTVHKKTMVGAQDSEKIHCNPRKKSKAKAVDKSGWVPLYHAASAEAH